MAILSVRASNDLPVQSDYLPLISLYFFLSITFTFISFNWFVFINNIRTETRLPKFFTNIIKIWQKKISKRIENETNLNQKEDFETFVSKLNTCAFYIVSTSMFISFLTIWLVIAN